MTEWKASLRATKVMLPDLAFLWYSAMNARGVRVVKSVAILGLAPHCAASERLSSKPFALERRELPCISPIVLLRRMPRSDFC
eukprot:2873132-Pyramimonas_sp.AAC.1